MSKCRCAISRGSFPSVSRNEPSDGDRPRPGATAPTIRWPRSPQVPCAVPAPRSGYPRPVPAVPSLLLVTDRRACGGRDLADVVAAACDAGLPAVQLREKDLCGRALYVLAERLRAVTARRRALLLVNERIDVAVAVGADGVHLGAGALAVPDARTLLPAGALVGVSTHAPEELAATDADYAVFGPVWETPSKRAFGPPQGVARLRAAVAAACVPVLAIGGVEVATAATARAAGARGVAVIRGILAADDPAAATRALHAACAPPPR
ncbi:MAG: thiamine phosphate synthase [bacterium]|nr:thiamine phosphate synthase [bacterium]